MGECHFLHNFTFDEGSACWKFVQHRVLPPACLPEDIPADVGTAFEVIKRDEWILRGGLRAGISLTLPTLHQIMAAIKCPKPTKGTGKNGRVKKVDIVTALVQYLWPDACEDFVKDTVGKVMGYATSTEDIDLSVLCMVSELDTDNQESFQRLKTQAARRIDRSLYGKGREAGIRAAKKELGTDKAAACKVDEAAAEKGKKLVENNLEKEKKENIRQWNLTPPELKLLLPGNGDVIGEDSGKQSCQRSFPTAQCPTALSAIQTVLQFAYDRWNAENPDNQYEMPPEQELRDHIATLGIEET
ncbi:Uncharacterized protein SCF082_LOCUS12784 [Durusdinium trenchii]|uniref:Uncharacterized protein n=1 Tax=Durusdinium trenchii TaxID=1381693 RepID=A0ABP0JM37_9DINO